MGTRARLVTYLRLKLISNRKSRTNQNQRSSPKSLQKLNLLFPNGQLKILIISASRRRGQSTLEPIILISRYWKKERWRVKVSGFLKKIERINFYLFENSKTFSIGNRKYFWSFFWFSLRMIIWGQLFFALFLSKTRAKLWRLILLLSAISTWIILSYVFYDLKMKVGKS